MKQIINGSIWCVYTKPILCMPSYLTTLQTLHVDENEMLTQLLNKTISFSDNNVRNIETIN